MVKTASLFSQLLQQVPRHEFAKLVHTHRAEYQAKAHLLQLENLTACPLGVYEAGKSVVPQFFRLGASHAYVLRKVGGRDTPQACTTFPATPWVCVRIT